ncbi:helix-turn-helix domain-containing protein [Croceitalea sp. MTPC9]|uniref:AraC family transcriptional regulator n=1 Tax=unclassified Croceitalea TaxID=2632280 RepID=UPI002B3AA0AB|nr:helix-turn-helix domain-containing protein [Croceitalea sp. MTPC6]GMN17128.1 helix-turn-helix domain-containing protein [Croceitalea sp. MTPC9]
MSKIEQYHLHRLSPQKLQFEVYDLKEYRRKSGNKAAVPHSHSYYQIIWFLDSKGTHTVDFKTYPIKKNTILFITKDQIHAFDDNYDCNGWLIHFNESFFMHTEVDIFLKYSIFKTQENPCYAMETEAIESGKTYLNLISKELSNRARFGFEDSVRFLLKCFLINLERVHQKRDVETTNRNDSYTLQLYQFKELVEKNYKNNLSINDYSSLMNISSKTLNTITKSVVNKLPSQLVAERIILEAKRLLKFTSLQIGEIAYKLGFEDPSYFIKYFKRHVTVAPLAFRNESSISNS